MLGMHLEEAPTKLTQMNLGMEQVGQKFQGDLNTARYGLQELVVVNTHLGLSIWWIWTYPGVRTKTEVWNGTSWTEINDIGYS